MIHLISFFWIHFTVAMKGDKKYLLWIWKDQTHGHAQFLLFIYKDSFCYLIQGRFARKYRIPCWTIQSQQKILIHYSDPESSLPLASTFTCGHNCTHNNSLITQLTEITLLLLRRTSGCVIQGFLPASCFQYYISSPS